MRPIYLVTGPPGAGKSTLAEALAASASFGVHIPVDDLRLWVKGGLSDSVPWTEETERQFQVAEESAAAVARRYQEAGFLAVIDHCRNLRRLDEMAGRLLADRPVRKILLLPSLDVNLARNLERTNKAFDPRVLEETIRFTNAMFREAGSEDWTVIDNTSLSPEAVFRLAARAENEKAPDHDDPEPL